MLIFLFHLSIWIKFGLTDSTNNDAAFLPAPSPTTMSPILQTNVTLNSSSTYYAFWLDDLQVSQYITVCTDDDDALELFVSSSDFTLYNYILFDFNGYNNEVGSLASDAISTKEKMQPRSIISNSSCFTIFHADNNSQIYTTVFFRRKIQQTQNCRVNNIFQVPYQDNMTFTVSTIQYNPCEIIVLAPPMYNPLDQRSPLIRIGSISKTSGIDNYVFKSANNKKPLMSFNNTDAPNWRNINIYTNALSITITNYISVTLFNADLFIKKDAQIYQRGILVSPSYSGLSTKTENVLYSLDTESGTCSATFNVKSLDDECSVAVASAFGKSHTLSQNENYTIVDSTFNIFYSEKATPNSGFLIEYTLTSVNKMTLIDLSSSSPTYVLWLDNLKTLEAITVCSTDTKDTLQMFVTQTNYLGALETYFLYDSNGFEKFVGTLNTTKFTKISNSPRQITSFSRCFTLRSQNDYSHMDTTVLFRLKNAQSQNCHSSSNIFEVQANSSTISAAASTLYPCDVIILSSHSDYPNIPVNFFHNSFSGSYVLKSGINNKQLATISKDDTNSWKNFGISSPALIITIPSNQSLKLQLDSYNQSSYTIINTTEGQKGIIVSPYYIGLYQSYSSGPGALFVTNPCHSKSGKCGIRFIVNSLSDDNDVVYTKKGDSHNFHPNDDITVVETIVQVTVKSDAKNSSFLITYTIVNSSISTTFPLATLLMCFVFAVV